MDRLWAPWRKAYIRPESRKIQGCLFCRLGADKAHDVKNLIFKRSLYNFAILNLYPYNNGHVLIVPFRHVNGVEKLTPEEKLDWLDLYEKVQSAMEKKLKPHGFNIGMNLGRVAGAGIPKHLHLHIVPRWSGDANFMPVISKTKVISESLDSVYRLLSESLKKNPKPAKR